MTLSNPTMATLLAAGQMATSPDHLAHPYVDIAHRSALLYSFATLLLAVFVELSAWPAWVNAAAAATVILFFVGAIGSYILHGAKRDPTVRHHPAQSGVECRGACRLWRIRPGDRRDVGACLNGPSSARWHSYYGRRGAGGYGFRTVGVCGDRPSKGLLSELVLLSG